VAKAGRFSPCRRNGAYLVKTREAAKWAETNSKLIADEVTLGPYMSFIVRRTPRRLLHLLSYYKFAAKMIGSGRRVLDVGCSEGFGTQILAENSARCVGVDIDEAAVAWGNKSVANERLRFLCADILKDRVGEFDAVVSLDVVEHIFTEHENEFMAALRANLTHRGICIIGTPNINSDQYANEHTRLGHVNLYSAERLRLLGERYFNHVFMFSANDEIVHTGFAPLAHYLIALCVDPTEPLH
jgi:2-polyprenyl-3-methyl-5-hydroxy-6-metoxy-1,4-benzoquinol methylase